jgi:hypothetical protein
MTVCGFVIGGSGNGYVWGDTEQYLNGQPMTHPVDKGAASPGGLAAVPIADDGVCPRRCEFY